MGEGTVSAGDESVSGLRGKEGELVEHCCRSGKVGVKVV